jgi:hypothetical protein
MVETLIATVVYGALFYFVFLGRIFDGGHFNRGN